MKTIEARIGMDNGVSGAIGIITKDDTFFYMAKDYCTGPIQDWTKKKKNRNRCDPIKLRNILRPFDHPNTKIQMERPMINGARFNATISAVCFAEVVWVVATKVMKLNLQIIDSKLWQNELLPSGIKGSVELKKASLQVGTRMFPRFEVEIKKQKDADGLLIAEYCRIFHHM